MLQLYYTTSGLELAGEVVEAQKETVNLKLDIDGGKGCSEYAWRWAPSSGNVMYCMPKKGTKARLCFGTGRASSGLAEGGIRDNGGAGGTCQGMSDSQNRTFVTEHGKKMELFPEQLCFQGQDMLRAFLDDQKGIIFQSHKAVDIIAADQLILNGQFINAVTLQEINMYRNARKAAEKVAGIQPKGSRNPATGGGGDSGFTLSNEFNALAKVNILCGTDIIEYNYFEDDIDEEPYLSTKVKVGIFGKVLAGLAVVAVVALAAAYVASVVFTAGATAAAAPFIVGGLAALCGMAAVVATALQDDGSKSVLEYMGKGFLGAITGAFAAAAFMMVPYAAEALITMAFSGAPGILLGGKFITAATLVNVTMGPMYLLTGTNIFMKLNESVAQVIGNNPLQNVLDANGRNLYEPVKDISAASSGMIFFLGLLNPNLYNKNNLPTEEELNNAANEWGRMQKELAKSKRQAAKFNTATVAYDSKTGKYYYGMNKGVNISGDTLNETLKQMLPKQSMNNFAIGNCAEVDAVNQALNNGAKIKNLYLYTVEMRTGVAKIACENCTYTFWGKVADIISGIFGG